MKKLELLHPGLASIVKNCATFLLFTLSILLSTTSALQANCNDGILANWSFEDSDDGWNSPSTEQVIQSDYVAEGNFGIYINSGNSGNFGELLSAPVAATPGILYNASFWSGTHNPSYDHIAGIQFLNASGGVINSATVHVNHDVDGGNDLASYFVSGIAPVGTTHLRFRGISTGDFLKLDAVCITADNTNNCDDASVSLGDDLTICEGEEITLAASISCSSNNGSCATRTVSNTNGCSVSTPYSIYLADGEGDGAFFFGNDDMVWEECQDGTATISGTVTRDGLTYSVQIDLSGYTTSTPSGSPKDNNCGVTNTNGWFYYTEMVGTFSNVASTETFTISKRGPAFQVGNNANETATGFGGCGWFDVSGSSTWEIGDINIMLGSFASVDVSSISYAWSTGETTSTIIVSPTSTQTYAVTVNGCDGCTGVGSNTDEIVITAEGACGASCSGISVSLGDDVEVCGNEDVRLTAEVSGKTSCNCSTRNIVDTEACNGLGNFSFYLQDAAGDGALFTANDDLVWEECGTGSASLNGTVSRNGITYSLDVHLGGFTTIPPVGSPKDNQCADTDANGWIYYTTLVGTVTDINTGQSFTISRRGEAFQIGFGANIVTQGFGGSGWFDIAGSDTWVVGDINLMLGNALSGGSTTTCGNGASCTTRSTNNTIACSNIGEYSFYLQAENGDGALFTANNDLVWEECAGSASLNGTVTRNGLMYALAVDLGGYTTSTPENSPKNNSCGDTNTAGWEYYTFMLGTVTEIATGESFTISRRGPAFQVGNGANEMSTGFGGSGWFWVIGSDTWTVGDINVMLGSEVAGNCNNSGGTEEISYIWSTGETTSSIVINTTSTQTYSVTVNGCDGCSATDEIVVTAEDECSAACSDISVSIGDDQTICAGDTVVINAVITGDTDCTQCATRSINDTEPCSEDGGFFSFYLETATGDGAKFLANDDLVWEECGEATATLNGTVSRNGLTYLLDVHFDGYTTNAPADSPKLNDCGNGTDASEWVYYTSMVGTVTDVITGASFTITRRGPAFQIGFGANNLSEGFGGSGWFDVTGSTTWAIGDINLMLGNALSGGTTISGSNNNNNGATCSTRDISNTVSCNDGGVYSFYLAATNGDGALFTANNDLVWEECNGGTATLNGTVSRDGVTYALAVDMWGYTTSAPTNSPKDNNCGGSTDATGWEYYTRMLGTVTDISTGESFTISRRGPAFQVGNDANEMSTGFGASGWFWVIGSPDFAIGDINLLLADAVSVDDNNGGNNGGGNDEVTYLWSTGATTSSISVSPTSTETYSVTVNSCNGCAVDEVEITVEEKDEITGIVWIDQNGNGCQDDNEPGVQDVTIELYECDENGAGGFDNGTGTLVTESITDAEGVYSFEDCYASDKQYYLKIKDVPAGYKLTNPFATGCDADKDSDADIITGKTGCMFADEGIDDKSFGLVGNMSIGSTVFIDADNDGIKEDTEDGIEGVTVGVYTLGADGVESNDDILVKEDDTDEFGNYFIDGLEPGDYIVKILTPDAIYSVSSSDVATSANPNNDTDNDDNGLQVDGAGSAVWSGIITLVPGDEPTGADENGAGGDQDDDNDDNGNMTVDFGFFGLTSIWGEVLADTNGDGAGNEDAPLQGVIISLYADTNGNGVLDADELAAGPIDEDETDEEGKYDFVDLLPGDYFVIQEDQVEGYGNVSDQDGSPDGDQGDDDTTVDNIIAVTTEPGEADMDNDFVEVELTSIWGDVTADTNGDGAGNEDAPLEGVIISLYADTNGNGVLDADELAAGPIDEDETDEEGKYDFVDLLPGDYFVIQEDQVEGYGNVSDQDGSPDGDQGDDDTTVDNIIAVTTEPGEADMDNDFVEVELTSIWGDVTADTNGDGAGNEDAPLEGVIISLYADTNGNGVLDADELAAGPIDEDETDEEGKYDFVDLLPGDYFVIQEDQVEGYGNVSDQDGSPDGDQGDDDTTVDNIIAVTTEPGEADMDNDFVEVELTSIWGDVTADTNGDGAGNEDAPLEGVIISLYADTNGNGVLDADELAAGPIDEDETDEEGKYDFVDLLPGDYFVIQEDQVEGYGNVSDQDGSPDGDQGDDDTTVDNIIAVTTEPGEADMDNDFVEEELGTISGNVGLDDDNDDAPDSPQANVTVTLQDADGNPVATTTTDDEGDYLFENVAPGDYLVVVEDPTGAQSVSDQDNSDDGDANDDDITVDNTIAVTLNAGEDDTDNDFVDELLGSIWGSVTVDTNNDDAGDDGIENITINLVDAAGTVVATTETEADGTFEFENVAPGDYTIVQVDPVGDDYQDVSDIDESIDANDPDGDDGATPNNEIPVTVTPGEADADNDFVDEQLGTIAGNVGLDDDNDDAPDSPQANVTVTLQDADGNPVATTTTDDEGDYLFENVAPGDYLVVVEDPTGAQSVSDQDNSDDGDANDDDITVDNTIAVTLNAGEDDTDNDFVDELLGSIWGSVTVDTNNDDAGDDGIENITINLVDAAGTVVATTETEADGTFEFENVAPGDYTIVQVDPVGGDYQDVSDIDESIDANDPDGDDGATPNNEIPVTVTPGEADADNDFVEEELGTIAGNVGLDDDNDDAPDSPQANVTVTLQDADGNPVATTTTDDEGDYLFENVAPGDYLVVVEDPTGAQSVSDQDNSDDGDANDDDITVDNTIAVTLNAGEDDTDNDFVDELLGSIWGSVTVDTNNDDAGDDGIENITINLVDAAGTVVATTETEADGTFEFENVAPGDYTIVQVDPVGDDYQDVSDIDESIDANDPDGDDGATPNNEIPVTVTPGEADADNDFVDEQLGTIAGNVGLDDDNDDAPDSPQANVTVTLQDADGNPVATTTTDDEGDYLFENVAPGDYLVVVEDPTGAQSVSDQDNSDDGDANDDDITVDNTIAVTLNAGEDDTDNDFVDELLGSIWGSVTVDTNNDDAGDDGIENITINLVDAAGTVVATTETEADGTFEFENVAPGDYTIVQVDPVGDDYQDVSDIDESIDANDPDGDDGATPNNEIPVTVTPGEADADNDFVDEQLGTIAGNVGLDDDNDDAPDSPQANVTVTLQDADGNPVATTTTDDEGDYLFENVAPGDYLVVVEDPTGAQSVSDQDNSDDGDANDDDITVDNTIAVTLNAGEDDTDNDFVDELLGSIWGSVTVDTNNDDAGDDGIENITINLVDAAGTVVATTETEADGTFEFENVAPGDYTIVQVDPVGDDYQDVSDIDESIDANDPDGDDGATPNNEIPVTVTPGEADADNDFVDEQLGTIAGNVGLDDDNDDAPDSPQANVTVTLQDADGNPVATTTTDDEGDYLFENVAPGDYLVVVEDPTGAQSVSDQDNSDDGDANDDDITVDNTIAVTLNAGEDDTDNDFVDELLGSIWGSVTVDTNNDDAGDDGIENITINLVDAAGTVVATTETEADGTFEFENVAPGDYTIVQVDPVGDDYQDVSDIDESIDANDPDGDDGATPNNEIPVTVTPGESDADNNFVDEQLAKIGGSVFSDLDGDGIQDPGEGPISNITVQLKDADGNVIATTTTNGSGDYVFEGVQPGTYSVVFVLADADNQQYSPSNEGGDDTIDSDAIAAMNGMTEPFTVNAGDDKDDVDAGIMTRGSICIATLKGCNDGTVLGEDYITVNYTFKYTDSNGTVEEGAGTLTAGDNCLDFFPGTVELNIALPTSPTGLGYATSNSDASATGDIAPITVTETNATQVNVLFADITDPYFDGLIPDETISCTEDVKFGTPQFLDNCGIPTLTHVDETTNGDCPNEYTITRTWTITDGCGNTASTSAKIFVKDNEGPTLLDIPNNKTYECDEVVYPKTPTAFDLCAGDVRVERDSIIEYSNECPQNYVITYTWSATDGCNDEVSATTVLTVVDTKAPVLSEVIEEIVVNLSIGDVIPDVPTVTASDNCDNDVTVEMSTDRNTEDCGYSLTYTWTAQDDCGNEATPRTQKVIVIEGIQATISPDVAEVCEGYTTTYTATPVGDEYNYAWSVTGGGTIVGTRETAVFTGETVGSYTVEVTVTRKDSQACSGSDEAVVEVKNLARTSVSNNGPICVGSMLRLDATGGTSYLWTGPNGFTSTDKSPVIMEAEEAAAGVYTVVITSGQCSETLTTEVTFFDEFDVTIVNNSPVCEGETVVLTASGGMDYMWLDAEGNLLDRGATLTIENATVATEGTYRVMVSSANGCIEEAETVVTISDKMDPVTTYADFCELEKYVWSVNGMEYSEAGTYTEPGIGCAADQILILTAIAKGDELITDVTICSDSSYTWAVNGETYTETTTVTVQGAGCEGNQVLNLTVETCVKECILPVIADISTTDAVCGGALGTATITLTVDPSDYVFTWIPNLGTPNAIGNTRTDLPGGTYEVIITYPGAEACFVKTTITINGESGPSADDVTVATTDASCGEDNGTADLSPDSFVYSWPDGSMTNSRDDLAAGDYNVKVTDPEVPTCPTYVVVTIGGGDDAITATPTVTSGDCEVGGTITLTVTGGSGNYTFDWAHIEGSDDTQNLDELEGGNYTVVITDDKGCSTTLVDIPVLVDCDPCTIGDNVQVVTTDETCNKGGSATFTPSTYTYTWLNDDTQAEFRDGLTAGTYMVEVKDPETDCSVIVDVVINEILPKDAVINVDDVILLTCANENGATVDFTVDYEVGFALPAEVIFVNDNAQTVSNGTLTAGNYCIYVKDANGCTVAKKCIMLRTPTALAATYEKLVATCDNGGVIDITITSGNAPYIFAWSDDATSEDRADLAAGTYSVTITDASSCETVLSDITIESDCDPCADGSGPTVEVSKMDAGCEDDGFIKLTVASDTNYDYNWADIEGPNDPKDRDGLAPATYKVTVTDENGCSVVRIITISSNCMECNDGPAITASKTDVTCDDAGTITLTLTSSNGTVRFDWLDIPGADNDMNRTGLVAGTYTVIATDDNNCDVELNYTIADNCDPNTDCTFFSEGQLSVSTMDCDAGATVCLEVSIEDFTNLELQVNDQAYDGGFTTCDTAGIEVTLPIGVHEVVIVDKISGCEDMIMVTVTCDDDLRMIFITMVPGEDTTYCFTAADFNLNGPITEVSLGCEDDANETVDFEVNSENDCVEISANAIGEDDGCLKVCTADAVCDSVIIIVNVVEGQGGNGVLPNAVDNDTLTTLDSEILVRALDNDEINGVLVGSGIITPPTNGTIVEIPGVGFQYTPNAGFCGEEDSFQYFIENENGRDSATVTIMVACDEVIVFSGFSPNGDGVNDKFEIPGIENYPNNTVCLFNRWGNQVFFKKGYNNAEAFDGIWNEGDLPDGTYFYMIDLGDGSEKKSGYVQIWR